MVAIYLGSGFINYKISSQTQPQLNPQFNPVKGSFQGLRPKQALISLLIGLLSTAIADGLSYTNPLWPALAIPVAVLGEVYPLTLKGRSFKSGVFTYIGAMFYINPKLTLICVGLAIENLWLGKDRLLTIMIFIGLVPILVEYEQLGPWFFGSALATEIIIILGLREPLWQRISSTKPVGRDPMNKG